MSPPAQALLLHPPPDVINRRSRHFGGRAEIHGCTTAVVRPGMTSSSCAEGRPGPGKRDDAGDELGVVEPVRGQEAGLVDPDRRDTREPGGVLDQGGAVLHDGAHHGAPPDAEHDRDRRGVLLVLTDKPAGLPAGSFGQRAPRRMSVLVSLHVVTSHALSWQRQSRWSQTSATGRPAEGRSRIVVRRRPRGDPAAQAPDLSRDRLDDLLELAEGPRHTEQDEPVEPEHGPASTTVMFHLGPVFFRVLDTTDLEAPGPASAQVELRVDHARPRFIDEEPANLEGPPERWPPPGLVSRCCLGKGAVSVSR